MPMKLEGEALVEANFLCQRRTSNLSDSPIRQGGQWLPCQCPSEAKLGSGPRVAVPQVWGISEFCCQCYCSRGDGGLPWRTGCPLASHWHGHQLLNVLKAEVVQTGQPTLINGAELDYLLASRTISPFIDIKVNWDVPWKPHAGLVVTIDSTAPNLHLPQVTQYAAVPRMQSSPKQWEEFQAATKPYWLGRQLGPKEIQCAEWCHRAEQYALQNLHEPRLGRGWYLALELKPMPPTRPMTPWRKGDLAYWGQFCSLLCQSYSHDAPQGKSS